MVLSNPFPGHTALTTFADLRRDLEGLVARTAAGVMRAGVFPDHLNQLVTGRSDMKVNIGDFRAVQNRGGAVLVANVGNDTSVTLPAAPGANKRIDLIYVTMRSTALGDAASTPLFGFVQGTASATPVAPSLPGNLSIAIPLATVEIPAGATTTLSPGVVITQVYPYTALAGGTVVVRNSVELAAWTPADGARAYCVADLSEYVRISGEWKKPVSDTGWESLRTLLGLSESWTDVGLGWRIRRRDGMVQLRGSNNNSTAYATLTAFALKLPERFRPDAPVVFNASTNASTIRKAIQIDSDGTFSVYSSAAGSAGWFLDGIQFPND